MLWQMLPFLKRRQPLLTRRKGYSPLCDSPASKITFIPQTEKVEEETHEWYQPGLFYPTRIGENFKDRYQVVAKLGYGSSATVWLCRDLGAHKYVAIKTCISNYPSVLRELAAFRRLKVLSKNSPFIQKCLDDFLIGVEGGVKHQCFVLEAFSLNLASCRLLFPNGVWDLTLFRRVTLEVLQALKVLHTEAKLIHCDLRQENFLMRVAEDEVFRKIEEHEGKYPSPRKKDGERVIHTTHPMALPSNFEHAVLCDFGEARPGDTGDMYVDDIQPFPYRSPEVILHVPFSYPADIWNAGVMLWSIFEGKGLFNPYTPSSGAESNMFHLREMVAFMGPPPPALLSRSKSLESLRKNYFDESGLWIAPIDIPLITLESAETRLEGRDKAEFLRFMRRFLQWDPERRATATELCEDPWLKSDSIRPSSSGI